MTRSKTELIPNVLPEVPACVKNSELVVWKTILHEVKVEVAVPLYADGDDPALHGQLGEVPPRQSDYVTQPEDLSQGILLGVIDGRLRAGNHIVASGMQKKKSQFGLLSLFQN